MEKISVIILNYNDKENTIKLLNNIKEYRSIDSIVVVDNNSPDDSYKVLREYHSGKIHVIKSDKNGGYGYGNNYGMKYAIKNLNPDYIIISNADVEFEEKVIVEMLDTYKVKEDAGIVAPTMLINGKLSTCRAWKLPSFKDDFLGASYMLDNRFGGKFKYNKDYFTGKYSEVEVIPGSLFMIKTSLMKEIDFFDEEFFLYCEECVLSKKILPLGYKNYLINDILFDHQHSGSIGKSANNTKVYEMMNNSKLLYQKKYNNIGKTQEWLYKRMIKLMIKRME